MPTEQFINVKGLAELQGFLDQLAPKLEANVMRGALRAGQQPIEAAAIAGCPVGEPSNEGARLYGDYKGALRDSIHIVTRINGQTVSASTVAGGKQRSGKAKGADVWYTHLIEYTGAAPHLIHPTKAVHALAFGGHLYKFTEHPGFQPIPFMRPALDRGAQAGVIAAGNYIKDRLATKEGLDTAHVMIEGDIP